MTPTEAITALERLRDSLERPLRVAGIPLGVLTRVECADLRTLLDAHAGALRDAEALRDERDELTDVLHRGGFVRCDIAACNCGSWHARFGYPERFREFAEALEQHGVNLHAGKTALNLLNEALDELDAARAALATNTKAQP